MRIPSFKLLFLLFEKHRETCGNFSENGEIYTYNIIYIMSMVLNAFFEKIDGKSHAEEFYTGLAYKTKTR